MHEKIGFYLAIILLAVIGTWGVWLIGFTPKPPLGELSETPTPITRSVSEIETAHSNTSPSNVATSNSALALEKIKRLIEGGQSKAAADSINAHYSELSSDDLNQTKSLFLRQFNLLIQTEKKHQAQRLLIDASSALDKLDIWNVLAGISIEIGDWPTAITAQLGSTNLETDPQRLEATLASIVASASQLRARYEQADDEISIRKLYQRLNEAYPGYPRFQLELAQSHIRLDNPELALPLLEQLQYDPELGRLAKQKIAALTQEQQSIKQEEVTALRSPKNKPSDILVPLNRVGNSFLVPTSVNGRSLPLLLDTGASITSLSTNLIRRLNLEPTGRSIQLNTANGVTRSKLYRARSVRLGQLSINDLIVAEIDLAQDSGFQGLLGTDVLNRINANYSYLIDNQQNALIFRRR